VFSVLEAERTWLLRKENPTMITKLVLAGVLIALRSVIYNKYVPWYAALAEIRKHNIKSVAIFVGTSGIGEGAASKLAELTSPEKNVVKYTRMSSQWTNTRTAHLVRQRGQ
jgi:hypothetical protein